jgi:cytochrome P450
VPLLGNTLDVWRDPIGLMSRAVADHGDIVQLRFGPYRYVVLNHPEAIRHVLVDQPRRYTKSRNYNGLKLVLGQGLLTSEGDLWRRQRKLAQPAFHHEKLAGFADTMVRCTDAMLLRWSSMSELDVHKEMMRLTFRIVAKTLFGVEVEDHAQAMAEALGVVVRFAEHHVESLLPMPTWVPTPGNVRFRRAMRTLDRLVQQIIDERRRSGAPGGDLLAMLLASRDASTDEPTADALLRDEVMTVVLAGHETTANALTWAWYLLATHPDVAERVRAEVEHVLADRAPGPSDLPRLQTVMHVVQEAMRLYPPVWSFERQAIEDDVVLGYAVPRGTIVGVSPYVLHRSPAWWDAPNQFDPDRFSAERSAGRPRYAYVPFGAGPRVCIGASFAMMEAQIVVAMVARRFALGVESGRAPELELDVTLRPKSGLRMLVSPRASPAATAA